MVTLSEQKLILSALLILVIIVWTFTRARKLKKNFLIFLAFYLTALILAGANRMSSPDSALFKVGGFIWSLAPSQTAGWFMISLIVLVILLVLIFAAGCILIARLETRERASENIVIGGSQCR